MGHVGPIYSGSAKQAANFGENNFIPIGVRASNFPISEAIGEERRRLNGIDVGAGVKNDAVEGIRVGFTENMS